MPIDDFVREGEAPASHPLLRFLASRLHNGCHAVFHLHLPPKRMGYTKAKISVRLFQGDEEVEVKSDDWDDDLDDDLIRLGIKAETPENEKDRFALALRASFRRPERRFGDGFFNRVLLEFVLDSDFRTHPEVAEVLKHISHTPMDRGRSYADCREMIEYGIRARGLELTKALTYEVPVAADILAGPWPDTWTRGFRSPTGVCLGCSDKRPAGDVSRLARQEVREGISRRLQELGFRFVTIDLEGFRSGSMNELIPLELRRRFTTPP